MKKLSCFILVVCILCCFFTSCKTAPVEEPIEETVEEVIVTPEAVPEEVVEVVTEDYAVLNETLLSKVSEARAKAIAAGAENVFPTEFANVEKLVSLFEKAYAEDSVSKDYSSEAKNLIALYGAFEKAALATKSQKRIEELDFSQYDEKSYQAGKDYLNSFNEMLAGKDSLDSVSGQDLLKAAEGANNSFTTVINTGFKVLADNVRKEYIEVKSLADGIKAGVAHKEAYNQAVQEALDADAAYSRTSWESAYEGYQDAYLNMKDVYSIVADKREAAQKAMDEAAMKVQQVHEIAVQADEIAPIATEEENQ